MDIGIREEFMEHGGEERKVINCLNDDQHDEGMEQLITKGPNTVVAQNTSGAFGLGDHVVMETPP